MTRAMRGAAGGRVILSMAKVFVAAVVLGAWPELAAASGAATEIDYHAVPPTPDIRPYAVLPEKEPELSDSLLWQKLRSKIKYVFVIYQENRSFDFYFGAFPGPTACFQGLQARHRVSTRNSSMPTDQRASFTPSA